MNRLLKFAIGTLGFVGVACSSDEKPSVEMYYSFEVDFLTLPAEKVKQ